MCRTRPTRRWPARPGPSASGPTRYASCRATGWDACGPTFSSRPSGSTRGSGASPCSSRLMREGDAGDRFSIVERGALDVVRDGRTIARLGPGEGVGEIALLRNVPRTATVRAASPAVVAFLERDVFL